MTIQSASDARYRIRKTSPDRPLVLVLKPLDGSAVDLIVGHSSYARKLVADGGGAFVHQETPALELAAYFLKCKGV